MMLYPHDRTLLDQMLEASGTFGKKTQTNYEWFIESIGLQLKETTAASREIFHSIYLQYIDDEHQDSAKVRASGDLELFPEYIHKVVNGIRWKRYKDSQKEAERGV